MRVDDIFSKTPQPISLEIFPPKGQLTLDAARKVVSELSQLSPDFISVTCSAGGSGNSGQTNDIAAMIHDDYAVSSVVHLTCQGLSREDLESKIATMRQIGVENVLALRGDAVPGMKASPFEYAKDIIPSLVDAGFCVGAAAYAEGHIGCMDLQESVQHLKQKQNVGASFFVTQLFFDNQVYYRFRDEAEKAGISIPISCGIMPFLSKDQVSRMIFMCGASLPSPIIKLLARYEDDPKSLRQAGIEYACKQLEELAGQGADGLHVYSMNSSDIATAAMSALRK